MAADPDLEAVRSGDAAAFEAVVARHHGALMRLATSYVHDRALAEDVVQDTWIAALRSLPAFEGRSSFKTWLFRILANIARRRFRQEMRTVPFSSFDSEDGDGAAFSLVDPARLGSNGQWAVPPASWSGIPEDRLLGAETMHQVAGALDALPPHLREVLVLRDVAGWSPSEVSAFLGITDINQRVRLHRARAAVRRALAEYLR